MRVAVASLTLFFFFLASLAPSHATTVQEYSRSVVDAENSLIYFLAKLFELLNSRAENVRSVAYLTVNSTMTYNWASDRREIILSTIRYNDTLAGRVTQILTTIGSNASFTIGEEGRGKILINRTSIVRQDESVRQKLADSYTYFMREGLRFYSKLQHSIVAEVLS